SPGPCSFSILRHALAEPDLPSRRDDLLGVADHGGVGPRHDRHLLRLSSARLAAEVATTRMATLDGHRHRARSDPRAGADGLGGVFPHAAATPAFPGPVQVLYAAIEPGLPAGADSVFLHPRGYGRHYREFSLLADFPGLSP